MEVLIFSCVVAVLVVATIIGVIVELKTQVFRIKLPNRASFKKFDPDSYLHNIGFEDFEKIKKILEPNSRKTRLSVRWKYTTPAKRNTYSGSKSYNLKRVKKYVDIMEPTFLQGIDRVDGLNELYSDRLSKGVECDDGVPKIYGYVIHLNSHKGLVKVGYTSDRVFNRIEKQVKTAAHVSYNYDVVFVLPALDIRGDNFKDHSVHRVLKNSKIKNPMGEWFRCSIEEAKQAVYAVQRNENRIKKLK